MNSSMSPQALPAMVAELQDTLFAMDQAGVGLVKVAPDTGMILSMSAHFAARLGYRPEELSGNFSITSLQLVGEQVIRDRIAQVRRQGSHRFETVFQTRQGEHLPVEVFAYFQSSAVGQDCIIGFVTDISARKAAEEKVRQLHDELRDFSQLQVARQTVAALAHELNQPLSAVVSYASAAMKLLSPEQADHIKLKEALQASVQQALEAGGVVRKLQVLLDHPEAEMSDVPLNRLIHQALERFRADKLTSVPIAVQQPVVSVHVKINPVQMELVLVNLIRNAIESLADQADHPDPRIEIATSQQGQMAEIQVRDNGPGIAFKNRLKVFAPFFSTKPTGTGMGLAFSRAIVETHGGELWLEEDPRGGACFRLTLPLQRAQDA